MNQYKDVMKLCMRICCILIRNRIFEDAVNTFEEINRIFAAIDE